MNELALFAGAGGGILGGHLLGWRTVCAVEWDAYAASVLVARQNDGCLPPFPIWDDVQTFDGRPWRGRVDVISGGFPCQDISAAGKGAGIDGERSGMWAHMARIIGEVQPRYVFVENSPMLVGRGLARVLGDLASLGYDARWCVLGAHHAGAPHKRDRIWIVAYTNHHGQAPTKVAGGIGEGGHRGEAGEDAACQFAGLRAAGEHEDVAHARHMRGRDWPEPDEAKSASIARRGEDVVDADGKGLEGTDTLAGIGCGPCEQGQVSPVDAADVERKPGASWWATEPDMGRVANGVANRVDKLRAIGNGQVPAVAALAWEILTDQ
jgi:DNA (cytosine-5)-methyltransferase 1